VRVNSYAHKHSVATHHIRCLVSPHCCAYCSYVFCIRRIAVFRTIRWGGVCSTHVSTKLWPEHPKERGTLKTLYSSIWGNIKIDVKECNLTFVENRKYVEGLVAVDTPWQRDFWRQEVLTES
jgi:hypothetical protein